MLKSIVSPPAPAFTSLIAPRREQSFAAAVQAVRLVSAGVSTVNVLAANAGAAVKASAALVTLSPVRSARLPPGQHLMREDPLILALPRSSSGRGGGLAGTSR